MSENEISILEQAKQLSPEKIANIILHWLDEKKAKDVARVCIGLGIDHSAEVFKHFNEETLEKITLEITKLKSTSNDIVNTCLKDLVAEKRSGLTGGIQYANALLEKSFGREKAMNVLSKLTAAFKVRPFDLLYHVDVLSLYKVIKKQFKEKEFGRVTMSRLYSRELGMFKERMMYEYPKLLKEHGDAYNYEVFNIIRKTDDEWLVHFLLETLSEEGRLGFLCLMKASKYRKIRERGKKWHDLYKYYDGFVGTSLNVKEQNGKFYNLSPSLELLPCDLREDLKHYMYSNDIDINLYVDKLNKKSIALSLIYLDSKKRADLISMLVNDEDIGDDVEQVLDIMQEDKLGDLVVPYELFKGQKFHGSGVVREVERVYEKLISTYEDVYKDMTGLDALVESVYESGSDFLEEMYHPIACDAEDAYIGENEILDLKPEFLEFAIDKIDATLVAKGLRGMQDDTMYEILSCYPREQALKILDCVVSLNFPKTENENNARELCKQIYMTLSKHYPTKKWDFFYENDGVEY